MNDPFSLLGVDEHSDDETVRKAYLQKVRIHSPEQDPVHFQEIRSAYETIAEKRDRLGCYLFQTPNPDYSTLLNTFLQGDSSRHPDEQTMRALLADSLQAAQMPSQANRQDGGKAAVADPQKSQKAGGN